MIRNASRQDASAIAAIYNVYVLTTQISFELDAVDAAQMASRMQDVQDAGLPWLVFDDEAQVLGYAYASKWKPRLAYRFAVEVSVYVDPAQRGKKIGQQLYAALLTQLREIGMHTAIGGIALPNDASIALHEKMGFSKVAHFAQVGYKFDAWLDVGYWQVQL